MKQYIITSLVLLFMTTTTAFGQSLQLANMTQVGQINLTNPAAVANKRFYFGVSPFGGVGTSVAGANIFQVESGYLPGFISLDGLDDENFASTNVRVPIAFGFKVKKWNFNIHTASVVDAQIGFNKDFLGFVTQGNAPYIGQTLNLDPQFNVSMYQEFGFGISREILKIFTVGARAKYLVGLANINTVQGDLSLTTSDQFYQLEANADYQIQIAGMPGVATATELIDLPIDSFFNAQIQDPFGNLTGNTGVAFDIGGTMDIGEFLHVGLSILDIGTINWEKDAYQYDLSAAFKFDGIDAAGFLTGDDIASIADTLDRIVSLTSNEMSYSAGVNTKLYLTGRMKFGKGFYVNAVLRNEFTPNGVRTGFGVGAQKDFGRILSLGAMYSVRNGSFMNLGANMSLKLGPVQVFVLSDNLLPIVNQWEASNTNTRIGVNITLNDKKKD